MNRTAVFQVLFAGHIALQKFRFQHVSPFRIPILCESKDWSTESIANRIPMIRLRLLVQPTQSPFDITEQRSIFKYGNEKMLESQ
jgi:hypothetical protein